MLLALLQLSAASIAAVYRGLCVSLAWMRGAGEAAADLRLCAACGLCSPPLSLLAACVQLALRLMCGSCCSCCCCELLLFNCLVADSRMSFTGELGPDLLSKADLSSLGSRATSSRLLKGCNTVAAAASCIFP